MKTVADKASNTRHGAMGARHMIAFVLLTFLAGAAGLLALFTVATHVHRPVVFFGAGWSVLAIGTVAAGQALPPRSNRFGITAVALISITAASAASLFISEPISTLPTPNEYVRFTVSTGMNLAVVKLPAAQPTGTPIIVLHGGPGIPAIESSRRAFRPLSRAGYDVYIYAQRGSGNSSRLTNPDGYRRENDAADLEALRQELGLERIILVAHSYGASVAAQYLLDNSDKVEAAILISPAPLDPSDKSVDNVDARLSIMQRANLFRRLFVPRALMAYSLIQINPRAAHAYMGDKEADSRNDAVVRLAAPALHCSDAYSPEHSGGTGFYAMQTQQTKAARSRLPDLRSSLAGIRTPTLVVKGQCDYLSWTSALDYRDHLPNSTLLYIKFAGHNVHEDKPAVLQNSILAFLTGRPLPDLGAGAGKPLSYEGPP